MRRALSITALVLVGAGSVLAAPTPVVAAGPAAPSVLGVAPPAGPVAGTNIVLIRVSDATSVTSVDFGTTPSPSITSVGGDRLQAVAPQHAAGDVHIVVHAGALSSAAGPADVYRYVPNPPMLHLRSTTLGYTRGFLRDIACGSKGFCVTREFLPNRRIQPNYNLVTFGAGRAPTSTHAVIAPPRVLDTDLLACASPTLCVAGRWSFATVWDGHAWSRPAALTRGKTSPKVRAVTCASGTQLCVYIGATHAVVHTREGWHNSAYPRGFSRPASVACPTATWCLAVHQHGTAVFDGHRWRMGGKALSLGFRAQVSCASVRYCIAVGVHRAASWHDGHWHNQPALPRRRPIRYVRDVEPLACVAPHTCMAARPASVATLSDGAWSTAHAPPGRSIHGFACSPGGLCRATGFQGQAVRFEGGRFTRTDDVVKYQSYLVDVSCVAAGWCMTVDASGQAYLYANNVWTPQGHVDGREHLRAISCTPDHDCVAVDSATGTEPDGIYSGGRAVRYVDGQWQPPVQIDSGHTLIDVSCPSSTMCVAVDSYGRAITMHDGTWSAPQQVVDVAADPHAAFVDVSCPTEGYCVAAGKYTYELRDGTWRPITDLPNTGAVDCPDVDYCVFVDGIGIRVRTGGLLVTVLHNKSEQVYGNVTCTDRYFCVVDGPFTSQDGDPDYQQLYAVAGAALRKIGYDELSGGSVSCADRFCAAVSFRIRPGESWRPFFDAEAGPVS